MNPILSVILLSAAGVLGDYCIKISGKIPKTVDHRWFTAGLVIYALTAFGWLYAMRRMKLSSLGVVYSLTTVLLLVAIGVAVFHDKLRPTEILGIVLAIIAVILLGRYS